MGNSGKGEAVAGVGIGMRGCDKGMAGWLAFELFIRCVYVFSMAFGLANYAKSDPGSKCLLGEKYCQATATTRGGFWDMNWVINEPKMQILSQ